MTTHCAQACTQVSAAATRAPHLSAAASSPRLQPALLVRCTLVARALISGAVASAPQDNAVPRAHQAVRATPCRAPQFPARQRGHAQSRAACNGVLVASMPGGAEHARRKRQQSLLVAWERWNVRLASGQRPAPSDTCEAAHTSIITSARARTHGPQRSAARAQEMGTTMEGGMHRRRGREAEGKWREAFRAKVSFLFLFEGGGAISAKVARTV